MSNGGFDIYPLIEKALTARLAGDDFKRIVHAESGRALSDYVRTSELINEFVTCLSSKSRRRSRI